MENPCELENPCHDCKTRKLYAKLFDIHFGGEDCPSIVCMEYENYKKLKSKNDILEVDDDG